MAFLSVVKRCAYPDRYLAFMGYPISYVQIVSSALDFSKESDPSKLQRRWQQKLDLAYIHRIHTPSTYSYSFIARDALAFTWPSRNIIPHTYDAPEKILGSALLQTRIYWIYLIFIEFHLMTNQCFIEHLIVKSINVVKIENWKIVIANFFKYMNNKYIYPISVLFKKNW